jgi:RNA polymerase sigma-70 factor (ECF subfamily)
MSRLSDIYTEHVGLVRAIAWKYGVRKDDIEDVTQLVFLKVIKGLPNYTDEGKLTGWIGRIARNAAYDHSRQYWLRNVDSVEENFAELETSTDIEDDYARRVLVREALEELSAIQREVLFLRYVLGLSVTETALRLGKTKGSINLILHRACRNMQMKLTAREVA